MTAKSKTVSIVREQETLYAFEERKKITRSSDSHEILRSHWQDIDDVESFHVLALSRSNTVIGHKVVSYGGISGCVADPKIILRYAITTKGCAGIIVSHNHPSCNLSASQADINVTKQLKEACKALELPLIDHIIITPDNRYFSFADEGML